MKCFLKATGMALSLVDLFVSFPTKLLKMSCKVCEQLIGESDRNKLSYQIFKEHVKLVFNDIIDNNVTFQLPTGSRKSDIHIQAVRGNEFKNLKRHGKWHDIDFLETRFTGYRMSLFMYSPKRPPRVKEIYLDSKLKKKLTDYANSGKTYC